MSAKAKKNRGLGRGLDALFAEQAPIMPDNRVETEEKSNSYVRDKVLYIDINDIKPNAEQPRKTLIKKKYRSCLNLL